MAKVSIEEVDQKKSNLEQKLKRQGREIFERKRVFGDEEKGRGSRSRSQFFKEEDLVMETERRK